MDTIKVPSVKGPTSELDAALRAGRAGAAVTTAPPTGWSDTREKAD